LTAKTLGLTITETLLATEIIATLNTTVNVGLADPKLKARLANLGDSVSCLASGF
jgi:hypothetical protein